MRTQIFLIISVIASIAMAQQPTTNPALEHARELFAKQDWRAAADAYEALHQQEPAKYQYLIRLGMCRFNLNEFDKSIDAYTAALGHGAPEGFSRYNLACAQARAGKTEDAIENLQRTVAINFGRAAAYQNDNDLVSLHDDPRFKDLTEKLQHPTRGLKGADALDHWIGEWDVYVAGQLVGKSSITKTLDGFGVEEHWDALGNGKGQSFFVFQPTEGTWKQLWVDDRGWRVEKVGTPIENGIKLEGMSCLTNGTNHKAREFLTRNADGSVQQLLEDWDETSKSWQQTFDGKYVPRAATQSK